MANPKHKLEREEIMSFLLGELEEAETSRIESMFLSDPTYSEAIEEAKSELFEKYKSGQLTPQQSGRFEARYLPDLEEGKKKFQAMLDHNEEQRRAGVDPSASRPDVGTSSSKRPASAPVRSDTVAKPTPPAPAPAPKGNRKMLLLVGALVLILGGLLAAFILRGENGEGTPKAHEPVALAAFSVRGRSQVIVLPKLDTVVVHLPLPATESSETFSIVAYHGDGEEPWPARRVDDVVETTVQPQSLGVGRYDLELRRSDDSVVGYYSLRK